MFRFVKIRIFRENYSPHFYRPSLSIRYKYNFPIPSSNNPARYLKKKKKIYENRILFRIQYISCIQLHLKINFIDRVTTIEQATNFLLRRIDPAREHFPSIHDRLYTYIYIYRTRKVCPSIEINKGERNNNRGIMYDCARSISKKSFSTRN